MSVVALHLYEKLNDAVDEKARSKAIVEAFSELEDRYPNLRETATKRDLSETELRLQKEIEQVRLETEKIRTEIKTVEVNFAGMLHKQTLWIIGAIGSIIMSIRLLDWILMHLH